MADFPGQQPGSIPGNHLQRPSQGYPIQQPQMMFRPPPQQFGRPSPSYHQPSPAGQPTPPMGHYQQMGYQGSPHQQVAGRHFIGQSQQMGSPHTQGMNQGSPLVHPNSQQGNTQYPMSQESPAMNQRYNSPQMPSQNVPQSYQQRMPPNQFLPNQPVRPNLSQIEQQQYQPPMDYKMVPGTSTGTFTSMPEPTAKPNRFIHPASLALSRLLNEDPYIEPSLISIRKRSGDELAEDIEEVDEPPPKEYEERKQFRWNSMLKWRRNQVEEVERIEKDIEHGATEEEILTYPLIRGEVRVKQRLALMRFPLPKKKESSREQTGAADDNTVIKEKEEPMEVSEVAVVVSETPYIRPEVISKETVPELNPETREFHSGNYYPHYREIDGIPSIVREAAMERSFALREIQRADDVRLMTPDEWYGSLERIEPAAKVEPTLPAETSQSRREPDRLKGILSRSADKQDSKEQQMAKTKRISRKDDLVYGRNFFYLPLRKRNKELGPVRSTLEARQKTKMERKTRLLELIPWRCLQVDPEIESGKPLPKVYAWHPPLPIPQGHTVVPRIVPPASKESIWHPPCVWKSWHPPLVFDDRLIKKTLESLPKMSGEDEIIPMRREFLEPIDDMDVEKMERLSVVKFSTPPVTLEFESQPENEMEVTTTMFSPDAKPKKSIIKESKRMEVDERKESTGLVTVTRRMENVEVDGRSSPSLVTIPYPMITKSVHSGEVIKTTEPKEPLVEVDVTRNPHFPRTQKSVRLDDQRFAWLLTEYRVAQIRQNQISNIWDLNNQKIIELMKTKGASIDSSVREDAKRALTFLQEKAAHLIGRHAEIRNKLLQFCLDYSFDFDDRTTEDEDMFYMKQGDFIIQLEVDRYRIKEGWYFWNVSEPIEATNLIALMNHERWAEAYRGIARMIEVIPSSLTSEDKDIVYQSLSIMERDFRRYHETVEYRSHIFALNDMLPRTDVTPFAVIMPRPPIEIEHDLVDLPKINELFEFSRNVAVLKVQIDAMGTHPFALQSCLTPFLTWIKTESHSVGARFMFKFNRPIAIRYGAYEQLQGSIDEVVVEQNFINAYSTMVRLAHPHRSISVADIANNFILSFDTDSVSGNEEHDSLISGFYFTHPRQALSALYIVKKEVILNRLCESTYEQDPVVLDYKYTNGRMKGKMSVRLGEMKNGRLKFYFHYACIVVESCLIVTNYGTVEISHLRAAHHGNRISPGYSTAKDFEKILEKWSKKEPFRFTARQIAKLNKIISKTWNIPKLIDQIISYLKGQCKVKTDEIHFFQPISLAQRRTGRREIINRKTRIEQLKARLKELIEEQKKRRKAKRTNDHIKRNTDQDKDDGTGGSGSGSGSPGSSGKPEARNASGQDSFPRFDAEMSGSDSSSDFDAEMTKLAEEYKDRLLDFVAQNMDEILLGFKQSSLKDGKFNLKAVLKQLDDIQFSASVNIEEPISLEPKKRMQTVESARQSSDSLYEDDEDDTSSCDVDTFRSQRDEYYKRCVNFKYDDGFDDKQRWYNRWKYGKKKNGPLTFMEMREIRRKVTERKSKNYLHNAAFQKILWRKRLKRIPKQHRRGRRFNWQKVNIINQRLGAAWKHFIRYCNSDYDKYNAVPQTSVTWPMLNDQRVSINFGETSHDPEDEEITFGEMDEYFNISDSEERENICGYLTFTPDIIPAMEKKTFEKISPIVSVVGKLLPNTKKILQEKVKKLKEKNVNASWVSAWDENEISRLYSDILKRQSSTEMEKVDHDARPTALRFIAMVTKLRERQSSLFPNEALRHAAIALRDGPYAHSESNRACPPTPVNSRSSTPPKNQQSGSETRDTSHLASVEKEIERVIAGRKSEPIPTEEETEDEDHEVQKETSSKSDSDDDSSSVVTVPELNFGPSTNPITPSFNSTMFLAHQKAVQAFNEPISQSVNSITYVEQVRSKLLRIWKYFEPYYKSAAAFERMLEIYGPVAIYNQLQGQRCNLEIEKQREEAQRHSQQDYMRYMAQGQMHSQQPNQQQSQSMQPWQRPQVSMNQFNASGNQPPFPLTPQRMPQPPTGMSSNPLAAMTNMSMGSYDAQGHFQASQPQDFFPESSSSSAVSTPTSAGPLQSPFTPTGISRRRGRGGKRSNMGERTPSGEVGMIGSPLMDMQKTAAKRGRPRKHPIPPSPQMMGTAGAPPQSPLSRGYQQPYTQALMGSQGQNFSNFYPGQSPQQFNQPYPPRFGYPQQSPSNPQMAMQMKFTRPDMSQGFSHSSYEPSSSDDEETDPPPPSIMPGMTPLSQKTPFDQGDDNDDSLSQMPVMTAEMDDSTQSQDYFEAKEKFKSMGRKGEKSAFGSSEKEREKLKKRKKSVIGKGSTDDEDSQEASSSQKSPIKAMKLSTGEKKSIDPSLKKKSDKDLSKLLSKESRKRPMGDGHEVPSKKLKEVLVDIPKFNFELPINPMTNQRKKLQAQIVPEPGLLVEIPIEYIHKLYEAHIAASGPNSVITKRVVDKWKKKCMDAASKTHSELEVILDDKKRLLAMLENAQDRQKREIALMEAAEKAQIERSLKLKEAMAAKKDQPQKPKLRPLTSNPNIGKSPLDSSETLSRILDQTIPEKKKPKDAASRAARAAKEMDAEAAYMAAIEAVTSNTIGMEALKSFKIPKVQDADKDKEGKAKEGDSGNEKEREKDEEQDDKDHRYDDYPHDYHRDEYGRGGFHHHGDRRGAAPTGYHNRRHNRSPRGESYERRGGASGSHYPSHRGGRGGPGGTYRGGRGGFRDERPPPREWKGHGPRPHEDFYEGLPPKQQQLNREAGAGIEEEYQSGEYAMDPRFSATRFEGGPGFPPPPQRKVLLPNRVSEVRPPYDPATQQANRPGGWNHSGFFNQPATGSASGPSAQPLHKTSQQQGNFQAHSSGGERRPLPEQKGTVRPRESRDSPPDVGLQIDESD
ncbi:hypothetical protein FO519_000638 [Halicephalobus sp. NKZ332]|nr:hypothetical protein FO519_000638 [Halicephalobus sp. NKZ332]